MIRTTLLASLLSLLALPAAGQVVDPAEASTPHPDSVAVASPDLGHDPEVLRPAGDAVLLRTGVWLEGNIQFRPAADRPRHVIVNGTRYELNQLSAYRFRGRDYVVLAAHRRLDFPPVLVQVAPGRIELFREPRYSGADFYRHDGGPIQLLNRRNLRADIGDHPEALAHLRAEGFASFIGFTGFMVGLGLVGTGAAIQFDYLESPYSGVIVAGTGVGIAVLTNALVPGLRRQARLAAVRAYNR